MTVEVPEEHQTESLSCVVDERNGTCVIFDVENEEAFIQSELFYTIGRD